VRAPRRPCRCRWGSAGRCRFRGGRAARRRLGGRRPDDPSYACILRQQYVMRSTSGTRCMSERNRYGTHKPANCVVGVQKARVRHRIVSSLRCSANQIKLAKCTRHEYDTNMQQQSSARASMIWEQLPHRVLQQSVSASVEQKPTRFQAAVAHCIVQQAALRSAKCYGTRGCSRKCARTRTFCTRAHS
jgi:hypothetical protein